MASSNHRSITQFFRSAGALASAGAFDPEARPVVFVVRLEPESEDHLIVCDGDGSLVGRLRAYRGVDALHSVRRAEASQSRRVDAESEGPEPWLEIEFESDDTLPPDYRRFLRTLGLENAAIGLVPVPVAFSADSRRRPLNGAETALVARMCEGLEIGLRSGNAIRADLFRGTSISRVTVPCDPTIVTVAVDSIPVEPAPVRRSVAASEDLMYVIQILSARIGLAITERLAVFEPRVAEFLGEIRRIANRDDRSFTQSVFGCAQWLACRHPAIVRELLANADLGAISTTDDAILAACAGAKPRYYRVGESEHDFTEVVDVLDGTKHRVEDIALLQEDAIDRWTAGAIVHVGDRTLFSRWLPLLDFAQAERAPEIFERFDFTPTAHELSRRPDHVGRLADLLLLPPSRQVREIMRSRREQKDLAAGFRVDDPAVLRATLESRPDVVALDGDEYAWFDPDSTAGPERTRPRLATMRLVRLSEERGRFLVIEPRSEVALASAIAWLERIPGVSFEQLGAEAIARVLGSRAVAVDAAERDRRRARTRATLALERSIENWLDRPLPSLRGSTPRHAASDPKRRDIVRFLIGTIPGSPPDSACRVEPDRDALLARLGFGE